MATRSGAKLRHAVNAFTRRENERAPTMVGTTVSSYSSRPDKTRYRISSDRSIVSAIYTRMAIDIASVEMFHVKRDEQKRYVKDVNSGLNNCLTVEANVDQSGFALRLDIVLSLFHEGYIAIVPIETDLDPGETGGYDIQTMRVGSIVEWYPKSVRVSLYNDDTGRREELVLNKREVAIIPNPFYDVMNEPNSTLQRLTRKLTLLDGVDEQSGSGKLDIIIQLPYAIKSEARQQQAEQRRKDLEFQLKGSQYGIAYTDSTEKITQLNRGAENNLLKQIEYLTDQLYSYLGITKEVMNGTADEKTMLNYMDRTVEPILETIASEFRRKFLTKTARTQGHWIMYFKDPFKLVPMSVLAEIFDKLARNEIITSNEGRGIIGLKPADDPKADELRNSNLTREQAGFADPTAPVVEPEVEEPDEFGDSLDSLNDEVDAALDELGIEDDDT